MAGLAILGFVLLGIWQMSHRVATEGGLRGTIVAKEFTPQPETQITIGRQGVHERKVEGEYLLKVKVESGVYNVWVDKSVFDARKVGDTFYFARPPK